MNKIRVSKSVVGREEKHAIARVIDNAYLGMGTEVQKFEQEIQEFLSTDRDVICVNTGTAALHLALQALGIGYGDEVLVPTLTYVATFQAISAAGAKPIACDVSYKRGFIDLSDAESRLTPNTKAIIPVHYGSSSAGMDEVFLFAAKHGLRIIEDAAHSFGCTTNGKRIGSFGDITCFSFDGIKNITSGEGGAIVTGDQIVASKVKDARLLGVEKDSDKRYAGQRSWAFDVEHQGWRYHMSNLMAAIGREQLKKFDNFSACRVRLAQRYAIELKSIPNIDLMDFNYGIVVPHIFPIRVSGGCRDNLIAWLEEEGIETGIHYQPNHKLSFFETPYRLHVAEKLFDELLSIPMHPEVSDDEQSRIIGSIKRFFSEN